MIYNIDTFPYNDFYKYCKEQKTYKLRKREYKIVNMVSSFDIETTSTIYKEQKIGFMYLWGFSFDNKFIITGRRWEEFIFFIRKISDELEKEKMKLICYIHNASFEFCFAYHFLKKIDDNITYFATDKNKILKFEIRNMIFRCSYRLTNLSLDKACKKFNTDTKKLNQDKSNLDLDYTIIRTPNTKLTEREMSYFINDLKSTIEVVYKLLDIYKDTINTIPLTSTGYVRRMTRKSCNTYNFRKRFKKLVLTFPIYEMCVANKKGGDVHENRFQFGQVITNVDSYDLKSSYPYQMLVKYYPMSQFEFVDDYKKKFDYYIKHKCCLFYVYIDEIKIKRFNEMTIISRSHVLNEKDAKFITSDNGRIVHAKGCILCLNEIDYLNILRFYDLKGVRILKMAIAKRGKLPKEIRDVVFKLFKEKCDLEKYKGTELEYLYSNKKAELNAVYGMMLTSLIHDEYKISYDEEEGFIWNEDKKTNEEIVKELSEYNESFSHFLYYPWGLWVVSHSRKDLYDLCDCCNNHNYHDTDSCKGTNWNMKKLNKFNEERKQICIKNKIDYKNIYLGTAEHDGHYLEHVGFGAKKYAYRDTEGLHITIAGCGKSCASQLNDDIHNLKEGFIFKDATRQAVYSLDKPHYITINNDKIWTSGGVYICSGDYTLEMCDDYINKAVYLHAEEGII